MKMFIYQLKILVPVCAVILGVSTYYLKSDFVSADSKVLPTKCTSILAKDSEDKQNGDAAFNHDNHSFKNYSANGKSKIGCVECHHTDQPKSVAAPNLVRERNVALTIDNYSAAAAPNVKSCRACHLQVGDENFSDVMSNEEAYHRNCINCHKDAKKSFPKIPIDCKECHVKLGTLRVPDPCPSPGSSSSPIQTPTSIKSPAPMVSPVVTLTPTPTLTPTVKPTTPLKPSPTPSPKPVASPKPVVKPKKVVKKKG